MIFDADNRRPDFDRAQNAATDLLNNQCLGSLFIDVRTFQFDRRIIIDSIQSYASKTGQQVGDLICGEFSGSYVVKHPRCNLILYDEREKNECRKHWGIVHEVGHVYLGHENDGAVEEIEAHYFAAQITMPEVALRHISSRLGRLSTFDIAGVFNASHNAAARRIQTFSRRQGISYGARDIKLFEKLSPLLEAAYPVERADMFGTFA